MIKSLIRRLIAIAIDFIEHRSYSKFVKHIKGVNDRLWILDIDNTLANTWPNLKKRKGSFDTSFYENLPPLQGVIKYLSDQINLSQDRIVFLSARPFFLKNATYKWISNHFEISNKNQLYLVPDAQTKSKYFKTAKEALSSVTVVDDLSRNHENGKVLFYDDVIKEVQELNITYIGYNDLIMLEKQYS